MNLKKLLNFCLLLVFLATFVVGNTNAQTRFLNSTDGDDSYTGENATNNPLGTGPKRTLEGAFTAFASGTTVRMAAGVYNFDQSGIGGGNDANGYTIGTSANKSMTFVVETYNANNAVSLNGGPLTIDVGTGTIAFQPAVAGTNTVNLSGAGALTLTSGTLDVSAMGATGFSVAATINNIIRTEGALAGTLNFAAGDRNVTFNGTTSKTAGNEVPANIQAGTLNIAQATGTITFPNALTVTTGVIQLTGAGNATFSGIITGGANNATGLQILNTNTGTLTFNGAVTLSTRDNNFTAPVISNTVGGRINFNADLVFDHTASGTAGTADRTAQINNGGAGRITMAMLNHNVGTDNASPANTVRIIVDVVNAAAGIVDIGNGSEIRGNLTNNNAGTVNVNGGVTIFGVISNNNAASVIALGANTLTVAGVGAHTNAGTISGSGNLAFTAGATVNGAGSLPNLVANSTALVTIAAATNINGSVTNSNTGGITLAAATTVTGSVIQNNNGNITFGAANLTVQGSINMAAGSGNVSLTAGNNTVQGSVSLNGGTGVLNTGNNLVISGTVTLNSGTLSLAGAGQTQVFGAFSQGGGTLTWAAAGVLDLKGNFTRTTGTVNPGTGTLQFTSGGAQTFIGGTNMRVYNFNVQSVGTGVTFNNGSLEVMNDATIVANTNVVLGTYNIRMLGAPAVAGNVTFTNGGQYTATGGGGIIFEGPATGGSQHIMSGNGVNSNIEVRLNAQNLFVDIADGQVVTWSGLLTLTRGTIRVGNGGGAAEQFNPSTILTTPTIRRNLGDTAPADGTADGFPITVGGTGSFNSTNQSYHLVYFGTLTANQAVGAEFVQGNPGRVINLDITAAGGGFAVTLPNSEMRFSGNLTIARDANLQLTGAANGALVSTGAGVTITVNGTISHTNAGVIRLDGTGTVTAGTNALDQATIMDLVVNSSGAYVINNLKLIGAAGAEGLTVTQGTVSLGVLNDGTPVTPRDIRNLTVNGGATTLTSDVEITTAVAITAGTFDLADFNIWQTGGVFGATGGTINATGSTTKGFLQFRASANLNTGAVLVPRIIVDPANVGGITVTLTGNSGVKEIFTNSNGTLAMGANTFTNAGSQWNTTGIYTGTGVMNITGPVSANLSGNVAIPNLTVNNGANTFTLVDNDGAATVPALTVNTLFTMTAGSVNLQNLDIVLAGAGGVFAYTAGTFTATTNNSEGATDDQNGEIVFTNAGAQSFAAAAGLSMPNVRFEGAGAVSLLTAPNVMITGRLVYGNAAVNFGSAGIGTLVLGDGVMIVREGAGALQNVPTFNGVVDILYTGVASVVGNEMPAAGTTILRDLHVAVNTNASKAITVNRLLHLEAGSYDPEPGATIFGIAMANGSTINRANGNIANQATGTFSVTGGPVTLIYSNSNAIATTSQEFPGTASFVSTLNVQGTNTLQLHATRSVGDFVLVTGAGSPPPTNVPFDLNTFTLNTASSTLTRGLLTSTGTVSTLNVTGALASTASATVNNVNVNANTATLAGTFQGGANATIVADASFAAFTGNATVGGDATLNNVFTGSLVVAGDLTIAAAGALNAASNVTFNGAADQIFTMGSGNETVNTLTINQTPSAHVTIPDNTPAATLTVTTTLNLTSGLLVTNNNALFLGNVVQGFTRGTGHVVGNVTKNFPAGASNRWEFPVGTEDAYRPVAITFLPGNPVITTTNITVGPIPVIPAGSEPSLTINGQFVNERSDFGWFIQSTISLGPSQTFDIEFEAPGLEDYGDITDVRVGSRQGSVNTNPWIGQGGIYANFETGTPVYPVIRVTNSQGNIINQGATFAILYGTTASFAVSGTVTYNNSTADPVEGIDVTLTPGGLTATTDAAGQYTIANVPVGDYTVTAATDNAWLPADAGDALLVLKSVVHNPDLAGLYLEAADVSNDNVLTSLDALRIQRRDAGLDNSFPAGDWVFSPATVSVTNEAKVVNIKALAMGDVNGDAMTGLPKQSPSVEVVKSDKINANPGSAIQVPVTVGSAMNLGAMSITLTYPVDLAKYESISTKAEGLIINNQTEGKIKISWASANALNLKENDALFTLKFKTTEQFVAGSIVDVEIDNTSKLYDGNGITVKNAVLKSSTVEGFVPTEFALKQNYPNPFNPSTIISYDIPVAGNVSLVIFNSLGEEVARLVNEVQNPGTYKYNFNANGLSSGLYFYRIDVNGDGKSFTKTHKMMLLK